MAGRGRFQREDGLRGAGPKRRGGLKKEVRADRSWGRERSDKLPCGVMLVRERTMAKDV